MIENDPAILDEMVEKFYERETAYRNTLRELLDWIRDKDGHLLATVAWMGDSNSYFTSASLKWIAANVFFARDLPIFRDQRVQGNGSIAINENTIHDIQQREPDFRRQLPMTVYLVTRRYHKFGPLLLVAYKEWVYDRNSEEWGPDGRALESSLSITSLDTKSHLVDLDVTDTQYFALDGQHRLLAIKGLQHLLDDGRLEAKSREGKPHIKSSITREDIDKFFDEHGDRLELDTTVLTRLLDEHMGIEILPAVEEGETYLEAVSRLRNIFVDVNETARRLEKGELTLLDENDGFRIVARIVLTKHCLFATSNGLRVNTKRPNVTEKSSDYTTLNTIVNIARVYLMPKQNFALWNNPIFGSNEYGYLRPSVEEVNDGVRELEKYFDAIASIPSLEAMMQGTEVAELRGRNGKDNVLFWPIAQTALAEAVANLQAKQNVPLTELTSIIAKYENDDQMRLTKRDAPWFGVLCDPIKLKIRTQKKYQALCADLFIFLLGSGNEDPNQLEGLRIRFFEARQGVVEDETKPKAYDISGELVTYDDFSLPFPWQ